MFVHECLWASSVYSWLVLTRASLSTLVRGLEVSSSLVVARYLDLGRLECSCALGHVRVCALPESELSLVCKAAACRRLQATFLSR